MCLIKKAVQKVELPTFDRQDSTGWLVHAEKSFEIQKTTTHWFRYLRKRLAKMAWEVLEVELLKRFFRSGTENPCEQLAAMHQTKFMMSTQGSSYISTQGRQFCT